MSGVDLRRVPVGAEYPADARNGPASHQRDPTKADPSRTRVRSARPGKVKGNGSAGPHFLRRTGYLAVHSVEKSFGSRQVVRGVSIYVRRGEAVGLLGPNGAGKTTVFYMITGLIKADRGAI